MVSVENETTLVKIAETDSNSAKWKFIINPHNYNYETQGATDKLKRDRFSCWSMKTSPSIACLFIKISTFVLIESWAINAVRLTKLTPMISISFSNLSSGCTLADMKDP